MSACSALYVPNCDRVLKNAYVLSEKQTGLEVVLPTWRNRTTERAGKDADVNVYEVGSVPSEIFFFYQKREFLRLFTQWSIIHSYSTGTYLVYSVEKKWALEGNSHKSFSYFILL